jgi:hypothetical protein
MGFFFNLSFPNFFHICDENLELKIKLLWTKLFLENSKCRNNLIDDIFQKISRFYYRTTAE